MLAGSLMPGTNNLLSVHLHLWWPASTRAAQAWILCLICYLQAGWSHGRHLLNFPRPLIFFIVISIHIGFSALTDIGYLSKTYNKHHKWCRKKRHFLIIIRTRTRVLFTIFTSQQVVEQCFSNFNTHANNLGILLQCRFRAVWGGAWESAFSASFWWCQGCCVMDHTLSSKALRSWLMQQ